MKVRDNERELNLNLKRLQQRLLTKYPNVTCNWPDSKLAQETIFLKNVSSSIFFPILIKKINLQSNKAK